jgi:hypothetical protein
MWIHNSDDQIDATSLQLTCVFQHLVGFADTWGIAKVDLEAATNG